MKYKHFKLGKTFWMSGKQYRVTDIGYRCVVAICIAQQYCPRNYADLLRGRKDFRKFISVCQMDLIRRGNRLKADWYEPIGQKSIVYAVAEYVIDPDDMKCCYSRAPDWYFEEYCRRRAI